MEIRTIGKLLMHEPRGHQGMSRCIITPPATKGADFGVLFMHKKVRVRCVVMNYWSH
ncbi:proline racemase family protein [Virgibacillus oceani]